MVPVPLLIGNAVYIPISRLIVVSHSLDGRRGFSCRDLRCAVTRI